MDLKVSNSRKSLLLSFQFWKALDKWGNREAATNFYWYDYALLEGWAEANGAPTSLPVKQKPIAGSSLSCRCPIQVFLFARSTVSPMTSYLNKGHERWREMNELEGKEYKWQINSNQSLVRLSVVSLCPSILLSLVVVVFVLAFISSRFKFCLSRLFCSLILTFLTNFL